MDANTGSTHLKDFIARSGISKNSLIRETGIDRSTFFQILAGKRIPTYDQFNRIIRLILSKTGFLWPSGYRGGYYSAATNLTYSKDVSSAVSLIDGLDTILDEFVSKRFDEDEYKKWGLVRSFISQANKYTSLDCQHQYNPTQKNAVTEKVRSSVTAFIDRQLNSEKGELDIYLSPELEESCEFSRLFSEQQCKRAKIRQLVGIPENNIASTYAAYWRNQAGIMKALDRGVVDIKIWQFDDLGDNKDIYLFPYYLIGKQEILMINASGTVCTLINDISVVNSFRREFENRIQSLEPALFSFDNYTSLAETLYERYRNFADGKMLFIADRPCALQLITPDLIHKYISDPGFSSFAVDYTQSLQSIKNFCGLMSPKGFASFEEDRHISESGMDFYLDDEDMPVINEMLGNMRGHRMLLVPFRDSFLHDWEIAIYNKEELLISLYRKPDCVFCSHDPSIIEAFFIYYESMRKILRGGEK